MTPEERQRRIREVGDRLAERLAGHWPEAGTDIVDLEDFAERMGQDVQRKVGKRTLEEEVVRRGRNQSARVCGGTALYRRHQELALVTAAGRQRVQRAYYFCDGCGAGHCPADARLRLGPSNTTPTAKARLTVLAALEPYVQVRELIQQLGLPLELNLKRRERVAQAAGTCLQQVELRPFVSADRAVVVGFDRVMIPTREGYK